MNSSQCQIYGFWLFQIIVCFLVLLIKYCKLALKDKYPNFEVGLKCILMVF